MTAPSRTPVRSRRPLRRRLRTRVGSALLSSLTRGLGQVSWAGAQRTGRALGRLAWLLARRDRRRAVEHLAVAFPELTDDERRRRARACFLHHGTNLAECLHLLGKGCPELFAHVSIEGREVILELAAAGRPALALTGHCGNWELLGPVFHCLGVPLSAVVRRLDEPRLHRPLAELRRRFGTQTIDRGQPGAARKLLRALRGGRALMMLIDQDTRVEGVWVPFFGRLAYTPVGAARVALKRGAAVVPVFDERLRDGSHRVRFLPPLELPQDPVAATAVMTEAIEAQIRRHPEQWVWMHRRWRRRPPEETMEPRREAAGVDSMSLP